MENFWKAALGVGGLGTVGAFVFYGLYKKWLDLKIFSALTSDQTFIIMLVFLGLTFLALLFILVVYLKSKGNKEDSTIVILTKAGGAMFEVEHDEEIRIKKDEIHKVVPAPQEQVGNTIVILQNEKTYNVVESVSDVKKKIK